MSISLINQYYNKVDDLIRYSGKNNELIISPSFDWLINAYCEKRKLKLIPQFEFKSKLGNRIRPDGTIKNDLRLDYGYWESKKAKVDLEKEIAAKFNDGYPKTNILFEDSKTAILYQQGERIMTANVRNAQELDKILTAFTTYEHPEVKNFNKAVENFKNDIPKIVVALREMISPPLIPPNWGDKGGFIEKRSFFWDLCKNSINPDISLIEINEMLIQHILTEEIFISIFSDAQFHQENNIAKELYEVEKTFFTGNTKRELLNNVRNYYEMIKAHATGIVSHTEKQTFLKSIYENFYKAYNPKGADRLGIVYTPSEIVKFQIESTDYLLEKHFGKTLSDKNVEILDPATGTGTYICDLLEYIPAQYLDYKYKHEIHANEVAILPYYIANLNIEYVFQQKMGYYAEFKNICFVDTLDNTGGLNYEGKQFDMFGFSVENAERIKRQNEKKISVIMGNPPYNANQQNENDNNKNREYKEIDKRIKDTFIKNSTAQKTKVYDMYARFFRWAMDRVHDDGIVCFITNNSLIETKTFDGFRKSVYDEYDYAYIIDLGGDIRKLSGKDGIWMNENHTIFGLAAAVGICIVFLVKKKRNEKLPCQIYYIHPCDIRATRQEKFDFLKTNKMENIRFEKIMPDNKNSWIYENNDFDTFLQMYDKNSTENIFKSTSLGVSTNRDEWVYDIDKNNLINKMEYFISTYNNLIKNNNDTFPETIKWSRDLKRKFLQKKEMKFDVNMVKRSNRRPFFSHFWYVEKNLNDVLTQNHIDFYGNNLDEKNPSIGVVIEPQIPFVTLGTNTISNMHLGGRQTQQFPFYRYDKNGKKTENITDWALQQFQAHYGTLTVAKVCDRSQSECAAFGVVADPPNGLTKEAIFHYCYAVLHNTEYRKKYELNLKRDFPRIPFYTDFEKWAAWGKALMALHIDYETVAPFPLTRKDAQAKEGKEGYEFVPKAKLKADKEQGHIIIDDLTTLTGVPAQAWEYKLGNRSALEWVLDQYKESKPSDPTIAAKFNTYKFADYKEVVIDLLLRVCTVSVETQRIVGEMGQ